MERDFLKATNFLVDAGREIASLIPAKSGGRKPYWYNCLELYSNTITMREVREYKGRGIPEEQKYVDIKKHFSDYYELFQSDFSEELIKQDPVTGKKTFNESWIAAETDDLDVSDPEESEDEEEIPKKRKETEYEYNVSNRDIKITLARKEPGTKTFAIELPITEMYEAAKKVRKNGHKERHYPYAIIYGVYMCVMSSLPEPDPMMLKITSEIYELAKRQETGVKKSIKGAKKYIAPIMKRNGDIMDGLLNQVLSGIDDIPNDQIEQISESAQEHITAANASDGSLQSLLADFMPGSAEEVDKQMKDRGLTFENIRTMVDQHGSGAMSTEELMQSIPGLNVPTLDDIIDK